MKRFDFGCTHTENTPLAEPMLVFMNCFTPNVSACGQQPTAEPELHDRIMWLAYFAGFVSTEFKKVGRP